MKEQLLKLECFCSAWWIPCKSCLLPHWSNCLAEPSWEAELSRLVLLMLIPLISDVVFSWGEALSKSLQTSSSVREVDSESRAPRDETLARSEFWSWEKKRSSTSKMKGKQKYFWKKGAAFFVSANSRHDPLSSEDHRPVFRTDARQGKSHSGLNSYTRIPF